MLFIVDSLYWGIGNFALQISKANPHIEARICSAYAIRKTIKRFGIFSASFNVIHYLSPTPLESFATHSPIVTTIHHLDPEINSQTFLEPFYKSDAVMTVSNQWENQLKQHQFPPGKLWVVPFGVDTQAFHPAKKAERIKTRKILTLHKDDFIVGFSGKSTSNANGRKGLDCFTKAMKLLHQQLPNTKALIIGPGWKTWSKG